MSIDFQAIRADNPIADTVNRYLELKKRGGVYVAKCPFHNDSNPSFEVVPSKSKAFCMACGWHGDVIDFVAEFEGCDTAEAARRLGGNELPTSRPKLPDLPPDESSDWTPILPAPASAPAFDPSRVWNPRRGREVNWKRAMARCDAYLDAEGRVLGYVVRMEIDGKKLTPTVTYCRHVDGRECWASVKFPNPRPLQGLDALAARPDAAVLVVSGEKCREVGAAYLPGFVVVTWPGGDQNVLRARWEPLYGRSVTIWPDADQSGVGAAETLAQALHGRVATLRVIDTAGMPDGWDIADGVADGMDTAALRAWAGARVAAWTPAAGEPATEPTVAQEKTPAGTGVGAGTREGGGRDGEERIAGDAGAATLDDPAPVEGELVDLPSSPPDSAVYTAITTWTSLGLALSDRGTPNPNLDNAARLLERHPETVGRFWFDEFLGRILTTWNAAGEATEWTDSDDVRLALWMQRKMGIGRMAVGTARDAVTAVAMAHRRNECVEWLESLHWDGTDRLGALLPTAFGTLDDAYTQAVGRCWLVSMVARAFDPGCKVDTMPVFEGDQGIKKSTAMQTLVGARWFAESSESPTSKDFYQVLQGKLLIEIAEMDAFSRAEVNTIKRVITCRVDRYRAPYGRRAEDHPRMSVFAGTTNKDDWNRDETGARRFWPVACSRVDLVWLQRHREQLFAEAVARFQAGEAWWDVPDEDAKREQEARRSSDEWERIVDDYLIGLFETTVGDVLERALKVPQERWDKATQMRVGNILRALRWKRTTLRRSGRPIKLWLREGSNGGNELPL